MGRGTARRAVEGQNGRNPANHRFEIVQNEVRGDTKNLQPPRCEPSVTRRITRGAITSLVCIAVDLDDQPSLMAIEIRDIRAGWMLPAKLKASRSSP